MFYTSTFYTRLRTLFCASVMVLIFSTLASAQTRTATVQGTVKDSSGSTVSGAIVTLAQPITGYRQTVTTNEEGAYRFFNVPFNTYAIRAKANGFAAREQNIDIESTVPMAIDFALSVGAVSEEVTVRAGSDNLIERDKVQTSTVIDQSLIDRQSGASPSRGIENLVLAQPGFIADDNGRIHVRGSESQIQYVVDGVPVTDNLSAIFSSSLDARTLRSVEVITGSIPAEFGKKLAGIVNVTTKSGRELPTSGSFTLSGGSFSTGEVSADFSTHTDKFGIYGNVSGSTSQRFLDPPVIENFNNFGRAVKSLFRVDYEFTPRDTLRGTFITGGTNFQVPNRLDQESVGQRVRQQLRDNSQFLSYQKIFSTAVVGTFSFYNREDSSILLSNESSIPVVPFQDRTARSIGGIASFNVTGRGQNIKFGFEGNSIPVRERFSFYVTDSSAFEPFTDEAGNEIPNPALQFTRDNPFLFNERRRGREISFYVQDRFSPIKNLTLDLGVRYDNYRVVVKGNQVSPRLGAAYYFPRTRTILRASYNRIYHTPPIENLLLASSVQAGALSPLAAVQGLSGVRLVRPDRQNVFEGGFEQQVSRYLRFSATAYHKQIRDFADKDQFLDTGIIFPISLFAGRVTGFESRVDVAEVQGFRGFFSYANSRSFGITPVNGGLFLGESVESLENPGLRFPNDHDQRNNGQFRVLYDNRRSGFFVAIGARYDSGLPVEVEGTREDLEAEGISPRILDEVNFERGRIRPRTLWDFSTGIDLFRRERASIRAQFDIQNFTNKFFIYNFESVFSGTHVGYPRLFSGRVTVSFK